jgi:transcriptional regulator with XRE-family HTH domain
MPAQANPSHQSWRPVGLGCAIRRLRHARGLTIEDLAFAAGMHATYLSGIERGVRNPSWSKLCGLADALDVPLTTLTREAEQEAVVARGAAAARTRVKGRDSRPTLHRPDRGA